MLRQPDRVESEAIGSANDGEGVFENRVEAARAVGRCGKLEKQIEIHTRREWRLPASRSVR